MTFEQAFTVVEETVASLREGANGLRANRAAAPKAYDEAAAAYDEQADALDLVLSYAKAARAAKKANKREE